MSGQLISLFLFCSAVAPVQERRVDLSREISLWQVIQIAQKKPEKKVWWSSQLYDDGDQANLEDGDQANLDDDYQANVDDVDHANDENDEHWSRFIKGDQFVTSHSDCWKKRGEKGRNSSAAICSSRLAVKDRRAYHQDIKWSNHNNHKVFSVDAVIERQVDGMGAGEGHVGGFGQLGGVEEWGLGVQDCS